MNKQEWKKEFLSKFTIKTKIRYGVQTIYFKKNGVLHNDNGPAIMSDDGNEEWRINGVLHRVDGPALVFYESDFDYDRRQEEELEELYREGDPRLFRDVYTLDIESIDRVEYYINGVLHNDNGPAIIYSNGSKEWYKNGERHNDDGPAVISFSRGKEDCREYYINGVLHNDKGPAVIYNCGLKQWWVNGKHIKETYS